MVLVNRYCTRSVGKYIQYFSKHENDDIDFKGHFGKHESLKYQILKSTSDIRID